MQAKQSLYLSQMKSYNYCMSNIPKEYCFWDAKSEGDTIILIAISVMAIGILLITFHRLLNLYRFEELDLQKRKNLLQIHGLIFVWAIMFLIENAYAISSFYISLKNESQPNITNQSKTYAILDKIPSFLVRAIFLKICFFHFQGFMCRMEVKNFTLIEIKFFRALSVFFWVRIVVQGIGILAFLFFQQVDQIWTISTINVAIVLLDSLLTTLAQIYSLRIFMKKYDLLNLMQDQDKKKRESLIMIVTGALGFFVNLTFLIIQPLFGDIGACMDPFLDHLPFSITHTILGLFLLNFIPLLWILKMYSYIRHGSLYSQSLVESGGKFLSDQQK